MNIEIKLIIDNEEKTFYCTKIKGILMRKTASVMKVFNKLGDEFSAETLDEIVDYVVEVFGNQFTREDYYNNVELEDIMIEPQKVAEQIMNIAGSKIKN